MSQSVLDASIFGSWGISVKEKSAEKLNATGLSQKVCTERCKSCKYSKYLPSFRGTYGNTLMCDYICMEKKQRGCYAGDDCTCYVEDKRKSKYKDHRNEWNRGKYTR